MSNSHINTLNKAMNDLSALALHHNAQRQTGYASSADVGAAAKLAKATKDQRAKDALAALTARTVNQAPQPRIVSSNAVEIKVGGRVVRVEIK